MDGRPVCVSCGRFLGAYTRCRYCDEPARTFVPQLRMRVLALLLAVTGLWFVHHSAVTREPSRVALGEIDPRMNYAMVTVLGRMEGEAYVGRRQGQVDYVAFNIEERGAVVRVSMAGPAAAEWSAVRGLPREGARLQVRGKVLIRSGRVPGIRVERAEDIERIPEQVN